MLLSEKGLEFPISENSSAARPDHYCCISDIANSEILKTMRRILILEIYEKKTPTTTKAGASRYRQKGVLHQNVTRNS